MHNDPITYSSDSVIHLLFPKWPRLLASSGGAQGSWVRQLKALCQFENRHIRNVGINLIPEDFRQKENVLEYFPCRRFLVTPSHKNLLINQPKKQRRSIVTDERLCSTAGNLANNNSTKLIKQRVCHGTLKKNLLAVSTVLYPIGFTAHQRINGLLGNAAMSYRHCGLALIILCF